MPIALRGVEGLAGPTPGPCQKMKYGHIPGLSRQVSRLILGTANMGIDNRRQSHAVLDAAFAMGCNAFDTARVYRSGDSERLLGQWVAERRVRDRVVLITKGAHPIRGVCRVDPASIEADIEASLRALGVDHLDLYLLHRDAPSAPVGPILEVLNEQRSAGRLHAFGASNWDHRRIAEADDYAAAHGLTPFVASSPQFGLLAPARDPWHGTVSIGGRNGAAARAWYAARRMPVLAWSCLAGGLLGDRRSRDAAPATGRGASSSSADAYVSAHNANVLERAAELARAKRWDVAQVALSWLLLQPGLDVYAVIGCRSGEELRRDAEALQLRLSAREITWLGVEA